MVLANEEVVNGVCERCGSEVVHKVKSQWMLKITEYAQRLLDDLYTVDYIDRVKISQRNWIGRSTGAQVHFGTTAGDTLTVSTTRRTRCSARRIWSSRPSIRISKSGRTASEIWTRCAPTSRSRPKKSDFERTELVKDKTGVRLGGVCGSIRQQGRNPDFYYRIMS